jgi:hypothetical protein
MAQQLMKRTKRQRQGTKIYSVGRGFYILKPVHQFDIETKGKKKKKLWNELCIYILYYIISQQL